MSNIYTGPQWPELKTSNAYGMRFYEVPNGEKYPSITSVLGKRPGKQKGLQEWRQRVGEVEANKIARRGANRGTAFHNIVEDFLTEGYANFEEKLENDHKSRNLLAWAMFSQARHLIAESVGDIYLMEQSMYSTHYKVAGRCDLIAMFDGVPTVVDWKTSKQIKKDEWNEDYYTQCAAYGSMYSDHTGELIDDLAIVMVAENGEVEIFKKKISDYLPKLDELMEEFYDNMEEMLTAA
jgi:genome maintenance exonuclease 1